ncbi:MAG: hypothetical protein KDK99_09935 [Verrucomicrobiales bacterium]|nr:hypothetical protein [Verrucomicrobiales bacterium]
MPESQENPSPPAARPSRWRWTRRLSLGLVILLLLTAGILTLVWTQRVKLLRVGLQHAMPGWQADVSALDLRDRTVTLREVTLTDPSSGSAIGSLEAAKIRPHWRTLSEGQFKRIDLEGLSVDARWDQLQRLLSTWTAPAAPSTDPEIPPLPPLSPPDAESAAPNLASSSAGLALRLDDLHLSDSHIRLRSPDDTLAIRFDLDHELKNFHLSSSGDPAFDLSQLRLSHLQLTLPDGTETSPADIDLKASLDDQTGTLRLALGTLPELPVSQLLAAFLSEKKPTTTASNTAPSPKIPHPNPKKPTPTPWPRRVVIPRLELPAMDLSPPSDLRQRFGLGEWEIAGTLGLTATALELDLLHPSAIPQAEWQLVLTDLRLEKPNAPEAGHLRIPRLTIQLRTQPDHIEITACTLDKPDVHWTQDLQTLAQTVAEKLPASSNSPRTEPLPSLLLRRLDLTQAQLRTSPTDLLSARAQASLALHLQDIAIAPNTAPRSSASQTLSIADFQLDLSPDSPEAQHLTWRSLDLQVTPDALLDEGLIDSLHLDQPRLEGTLPPAWLQPSSPPPDAAPSPSETTAAFDITRLHIGDLSLKSGRLDLRGQLGETFDLGTDFNIATTAPRTHAVELTALRLRATDLDPNPVVQAQSLRATINLTQLFNHHRIESLQLTDGQVEVNDSLFELLPPPSDTPQATPTASSKPPKGRTWSAGRVEVQDLGITLHKIAPGLPSLHFNVQFEADDTPLQPEGLVAHVAPQKVELTGLTILAPYGSFRPVARLGSIFVHFTLDDLLHSKLRRIEVISPTLYVGEPLFWYVDYYRKYAAGEIRSDTDAPAFALTSKQTTISPDPATAIAAPGSTTPGWTVEELAVEGGKIVIAPKGVPLAGFRQPFPFSFSTRLESGHFDAELEIPKDTYPIEKLDLEFRGMRGKVLFNLPIKTQDNNLTETFWVDQIRWKQLHIEEAHLSVTYDENGVYGKFGGAAYEGYIDGQFNIYNDLNYTWDGWIAGTRVRATEITEKMTPAYLLLDGLVSGKVIATGNASELYQADLEVTSEQPGRFVISGLDDLLKEYAPSVAPSLTDQVTRIGLETLRDFEYDDAQIGARFYGREGKGNLRVVGPTGSRNIDVNVYDHRLQPDPPKTTAASDP